MAVERRVSMTDRELIQALRKTAMVITAETIAWDDLKIAAADRLEALLAENAEIKRELKGAKEYSDYLRNENLCYRKENNHLREDAKMIPRWVSVDERLPENSDEQVLAVVSGFYDGMYFHDALEIAEFPWDEGWILEAYPEWENPNVTYWCKLPEPPSTEGVE